MISIRLTEEGEWSVTYHRKGTRATEVLTRDYSVAVKEIEQKMGLLHTVQYGKVMGCGKSQ